MREGEGDPGLYDFRSYNDRHPIRWPAARLSRCGSPPTSVCQHHPKIVAHADSLGWECFSHGIYNTRYSHGKMPQLLVEAGVNTMYDWVNYELPYRFATAAGPITSFPLSHELADCQIIMVQQQAVDGYARQIEDAYDWIDGDVDAYGGRMLPLYLTSYIMGLPYRIGAFEALLARLAAKPGAWFASGQDVASFTAWP